jgi:hypothetical protein
VFLQIELRVILNWLERAEGMLDYSKGAERYQYNKMKKIN